MRNKLSKEQIEKRYNKNPIRKNEIPGITGFIGTRIKFILFVCNKVSFLQGIQNVVMKTSR